MQHSIRHPPWGDRLLLVARAERQCAMRSGIPSWVIREVATAARRQRLMFRGDKVRCVWCRSFGKTDSRFQKRAHQLSARELRDVPPAPV